MTSDMQTLINAGVVIVVGFIVWFFVLWPLWGYIREPSRYHREQFVGSVATLIVIAAGFAVFFTLWRIFTERTEGNLPTLITSIAVFVVANYILDKYGQPNP